MSWWLGGRVEADLTIYSTLDDGLGRSLSLRVEFFEKSIRKACREFSREQLAARGNWVMIESRD